MLREAKLICPMNANDGTPLIHVHNGVRSALINSFGGSTELTAHGTWADDNGKIIAEPVIVFHVACADNLETRDILDSIADQIGYKARQYCVYVQYPSGDVVLRQTAHFWQDTRAHDLQDAVNKALTAA